MLQLRLKQTALLFSMIAMSAAAQAAEGDLDFSTWFAELPKGAIIAGMMGAGLLLAGIYASRKGIRVMLGFLK